MASDAGVIFAYGDCIYTMSQTPLSPELIAHENAHGERQREMGVELWWALYIVDAQFRYDEELIGHRAEYKNLIESAISRQERRRALKQVAKRLCSPLYGRMVSAKQAQKDILNG